MWQQSPAQTDIRNSRISTLKFYFGDFISLGSLPTPDSTNNSKSRDDHRTSGPFRWWELPYRSEGDLILTARGSLLRVNWSTGDVTPPPLPSKRQRNI